MRNSDVLAEVYTLLYNARIHGSNTFGTQEECAHIKELVYCGAYKSAVRAIGRIKGGRGGGQVKRNRAMELLRTLYMPRIVKVQLGSIFTLDSAIEKFKAEHPECEQFCGDMRKNKVSCKTVYRLYVYDPKTKINTYKIIFIERA